MTSVLRSFAVPTALLVSARIELLSIKNLFLSNGHSGGHRSHAFTKISRPLVEAHPLIVQ